MNERFKSLIPALLFLNVILFGLGFIIARAPYQAQTALTVSWADDVPLFVPATDPSKDDLIFFQITTNKTAAGRCNILDPLSTDPEDLFVNCPPGTLVSLELPPLYECGAIRLNGVATTPDKSETATVTGSVTPKACPPLTLSLAVTYDYTGGTVDITPTSSVAAATISCTINGGTAFNCPSGSKVKRTQAASATYTIVASATHGSDSASATVVLVVPAAPGPAATATPTPAPLTVGLEVEYVNGVLGITSSSSRQSANITCTIDGGTAFLCPAGLKVQRTKAANATYTIVATATDGGASVSATVVLVVPASGPGATATPHVPLDVSVSSATYSESQDRVYIQTTSNKASGTYNCKVEYYEAGATLPRWSMINAVTCNPGSAISISTANVCGALTATLYASADGESAVAKRTFTKPCPDFTASIVELSWNSSQERIWYRITYSPTFQNVYCQLTLNAGSIPCSPGDLRSFDGEAGGVYIFRISVSAGGKSASAEGSISISADGNSATTPTPTPTPIPHVPLDVSVSSATYSESQDRVYIQTTSNKASGTYNCKVEYYEAGATLPRWSMINAVTCNPGSAISISTANVCGALTATLYASADGESAVAKRTFTKPCPDFTASIVELSWNSSQERIWYRITYSPTFQNVYCQLTLNAGSIPCSPGDLRSFDGEAGGVYIFRISVSAGGKSASAEGSISISADGNSATTPTPTPTPIPPLSVGLSSVSYQASTNAVSFSTTSTRETGTYSCQVAHDDFAGTIADPIACAPGSSAHSISLGDYCGAELKLKLTAADGDDSASAEQVFGKPCPTLSVSFQDFLYSYSTGKVFYTASITIPSAALSCSINGETIACLPGTSSSIDGQPGEKYAFAASASWENQRASITNAMLLSNLPVTATTATPPTGGRESHELLNPVSGRLATPAARNSEGAGEWRATPTPRPTRTPTQDPARRPIPTQDHSWLPPGAEVKSASPWISFKEVRGAGIGVQSILDEGARSAIDVAGPLGVEAEVCFPGSGSLILLDAAYSPRLRMPLTAYARGDMTCGYLDRPGTIVLMPGSPDIIMPPPTATPPAGLAHAAAAGRAPFVPGSWSLSNCVVHSLYILNFRETPEGRIMSWFSGTGTALARTELWWQIVFNGEIGWVSADPAHSYGVGDCA